MVAICGAAATPITAIHKVTCVGETQQIHTTLGKALAISVWGDLRASWGGVRCCGGLGRGVGVGAGLE